MARLKLLILALFLATCFGSPTGSPTGNNGGRKRTDVSSSSLESSLESNPDILDEIAHRLDLESIKNLKMISKTTNHSLDLAGFHSHNMLGNLTSFISDLSLCHQLNHTVGIENTKVFYTTLYFYQNCPSLVSKLKNLHSLFILDSNFEQTNVYDEVKWEFIIPRLKASHGRLTNILVLVQVNSVNISLLKFMLQKPDLIFLRRPARFQILSTAMNDVIDFDGRFGDKQTALNQLSRMPCYFETKARVLIERGANINLADINGITPLMHAIQSTAHLDAKISNVLFLLSSGANVHVLSSMGTNALSIATDVDI